MQTTHAKYHIGQVLRHRKHPFRGVVFDVDAMFQNTDEWYENIPEDSRPSKDQPFYHLLAENAQTTYVAVDLTPTASGAALTASGGQAAGYTGTVPNAFSGRALP